jgi:shikimate kinase
MSSSFHHLYLTGYRGSGKTSVGKWLEGKLLRPVVDLDDRIEQAAGMSIREIFEREGEAGFRDRESAALLVVSQEKPSIVSLGGGAILREENRRIIATSGFCIWLKVDVDTVLSRLAQDTSTAERRPSLTTLPAREEVLTVLAAREPIYESVANGQIDATNKSIQTAGEEVLTLLPT